MYSTPACFNLLSFVLDPWCKNSKVYGINLTSTSKVTFDKSVQNLGFNFKTITNDAFYILQETSKHIYVSCLYVP